MTKKILVVDDESPIAEMISDFCAALGFETRVLNGAQDILPVVRSFKPDIITLDLVMPNLSGFDVIEILKKDPETAHIPVIVVSTIAANISTDDAIWKQAKAVLAKPLHMDRLKHTIEQALTASA